MQNRFAANKNGMPDPRHELKYFISDAAHAQLSALLGSEDAFFADFLWRESGQPLALFPWKSELR